MTLYVNTPNQGTLNMREKPYTKSFILKKIPFGAAVEGELTENWSKITYLDETGYVMTQFLSTKKESSSTVTKEELRRVQTELKNLVQMIDNILK